MSNIFDINEKDLCVLKLVSQDLQESEMQLEFVPIVSAEFGKESLDLIKEIEHKDFIDKSDFDLILIEALHKIATNLHNNRDITYCRSLGEPYQEVEFKILPNIGIVQLILSFDDIANREIQALLKTCLEFIKADIHLMSKVLDIQLAYNKCEENNTIKFYSHRKMGWKTPRIPLNESLAVDFDTNFGYGSKSYFYIKLFYKGIEIIPFSEFIFYRYSSIVEIKRYTRKYNPENSQWYDAMNFVKDAYNLLIRNEPYFIKRYIEQELYELQKGLNDLMYQDTFFEADKLYEYDQFGNILNSKFTGTELIKLRAEKLTQALELITTIQEFEQFIKVDEIINGIKALNRVFLPILEAEIYTVENNLNLAKNNEKIIVIALEQIVSRKEDIEKSTNKKLFTEEKLKHIKKNIATCQKDILILSQYRETILEEIKEQDQ